MDFGWSFGEYIQAQFLSWDASQSLDTGNALCRHKLPLGDCAPTLIERKRQGDNTTCCPRNSFN